MEYGARQMSEGVMVEGAESKPRITFQIEAASVAELIEALRKFVEKFS
jgi:hypothetical protein